MLVSSKRFGDKAEEVLGKELEKKPKHVKLEKKFGGANPVKVTMEGPEDGGGGSDVIYIWNDEQAGRTYYANFFFRS